MVEILMARVDDRLLHGQISMKWLPFLGADTVLIIDEKLSKDDFMKKIISAAAPKDISVIIMGLEEAAKYLQEDIQKRKIIILSKKIFNYEELIGKNIYLNKINIGCSGNMENSIKVCSNIYLSQDEIEAIKRIEKKGTAVEIQMLPETAKIAVKEII